MKFCPECGSAKTANACSCGFIFNQNVHKNATKIVVNPEHVKAFQYAVHKKTSQIRMVLWPLATLSCGVGLYTVFAPVAGDKDHIMAFFGLFIGALLFLGGIKSTLSAKAYYRLPGTQGVDGEHRCVMCGWRGIYRSTIYKTQTVTASCAKCKTHLFNE